MLGLVDENTDLCYNLLQITVRKIRVSRDSIIVADRANNHGADALCQPGRRRGWLAAVRRRG